MLLCTLSDVKTLLKITDDSQDDTLTLLIKQQSALICAYIGFNLAMDEYTDELQAVNNQQLIPLNNRPIQSVSKVLLNGIEIDDWKLLPQYASIGFLYRGAGWCGSMFTRGMTYDIVSGAYDISITYKAGWYLPDDEHYREGALDSLPYDISAACIEAVLERYNILTAGAEGIKAHSEGGISTTFEGSEANGSGSGGLSRKVAAMLEKYRVIGVA